MKLMKILTLLAAVFGFKTASADNCTNVLNHTVRELAGEKEINLCEEYKDKVVLIVNTASKCGFTGQYEGLEAMHAKYKDQGFAVLGFPSGDFANQEYREEGQIREFCRLTYGVKFPMFEKSVVRGDQASPLWADLIAVTGTAPKWNFYKYLICRDGKVIDVYSSVTSPENKGFISTVEKAIAVEPNS